MGIKILVVDDDANARMSLTDLLIENGYEVVEAATGEEALDRVREVHPDVVLLDTRLPDIDGNDVCRQIKEMEELTTRVIVYTGYIDAFNAAKARAAGADDYVVRTSDFPLLLEAIKRF